MAEAPPDAVAFAVGGKHGPSARIDLDDRPPITGEELLAFADRGPCELIDGRIIDMSPTGRRHAIAVRVFSANEDLEDEEILPGFRAKVGASFGV